MASDEGALHWAADRMGAADGKVTLAVYSWRGGRMDTTVLRILVPLCLPGLQ